LNCQDCNEIGVEEKGRVYLCLNGIVPKENRNRFVRYAYPEMEAMPVAVLCHDHAIRRRRLPIEEGSLENQEWLLRVDVAGMLRRRQEKEEVVVGEESLLLKRLGRVYHK